MADTAFPVETFGGLRLDADPTDIGSTAATDLLNVDFDQIGAVRTRNGSGKQNSSSAISVVGYQALFPSPTNGGELIAIRGVGGPAIDKLNGTTITNLAAAPASTAFPLSSAALGTSAATTLYLTFYDATTPAAVTIRKYNGTAISTGTGKPMHVATWPASNRLVQGGFAAAADSPTGADGSRSTVFFSDPDAPDTFGADNFVSCRAGDGETISAIVPWRDLLFVFKQSAVFVFYGESEESDGSPVFNFRRVDLPEPVMDPVALSRYARYAVAGPDAVYFSTPLGIWATSGGPPVRISDPVAPLFSSDSIHVSSGVRTGLFPVSLTWFNNRLIGSYTSVAGSQRQIVWHQPSGQWTLWGFPAGTFATLPSVGIGAIARDLVFFPNGNDIWVSGPSLVDDGGVAISWSYTSGRYDLGYPGQVKVVVETEVTGTGTVTLKHATWDAASSTAGVLDAGQAVTLGTSPASAMGWRSLDEEGRLFQHQLSGSGSAVVERLVHHVRSIMPLGVGG